MQGVPILIASLSVFLSVRSAKQFQGHQRSLEVSLEVYAIVHMRDIRKNVLPKFIKLYMETPCLCPSQGHKYGRRKPTERSVFEFSDLCMNSSLGERLKIKAIFVLRQGMFRQQNLQKSVMFLTLLRAFPAASQMPRDAKAWKFKASCIAKQRSLLNRNISRFIPL